MPEKANIFEKVILTRTATSDKNIMSSFTVFIGFENEEHIALYPFSDRKLQKFFEQ